MIQKVNSPAHLFLVGSAKSAENDPGGSSGSGLSYEPPPQQSSNSESNSDNPPSERNEAKETSELDKAGMTGVVINLLEIKDQSSTNPSPGLATKYLVDQSKTKGLLLNKKAE